MTTSWKLDCGPDGTILFGPQSTRYPFSTDPKIGDANRQVQDANLDGVDGSLFGIDTTAGQTIAFELTALGDTDAEAHALYATFRKAWRADSIRSVRGAVATLTAPSGRTVFGRPRRCTPIYYPDGAGAVGIIADFTTRDDLWYGPEQSLAVPLAVSQGGGLVAPLREPLVARGYTTQANTFVVDGDVDTWPTVTIRGQILNPSVEVAGAFQFAAPTSLAYDEDITISTRPGARSVLRNGSKIAALTRSSDLLSSAALSPGSHTLTLSGSGSTGSPEALISWRAAYSAP